MNKTELLSRLSDIEWDDFEVKEARNELPKSIWETVSAFSNVSGGWIVLGVVQKGKKFEIQGVDNPEKMEQDLLSVLRSRSKFNVMISPKCHKYKSLQQQNCFSESGKIPHRYIRSSKRSHIQTP